MAESSAKTVCLTRKSSSNKQDDFPGPSSHLYLQSQACWVGWYILVIPALRRLKQKDLKFKISLEFYIARLSKKKSLRLVHHCLLSLT
jgi:hypothetical protein